MGNNMTNDQKAMVYDACLRESDMLQRANSRLKAEHVTSMTPEVQKTIEKNNERIAELVRMLENLFE
jgi:hypothetical protein